MPNEPRYGTAAGQEVHLHTRNYMPALLRLGPRQLKHDLQAADTFNGKVAVVLTRVVGTMWCFWVFNGIALVSLPSAINSGNLTILIAWISSNWIQLILLPALMVGQNLQNLAADARSAKTMQGLPDPDAAAIHIEDPARSARHDAITRLWQAIGIPIDKPLHMTFVPTGRLAEYHAELDRFATLPALMDLRKVLS